MIDWLASLLDAFALPALGAGAVAAGAIGYGLSRRIMVAAVCAVLVASHGGVWLVAVDSTEARYEAAERKAAARLRAAETARLQAQAERDRLMQELEDAARADPDAGRIAIGADSVRRIDQR